MIVSATAADAVEAIPWSRLLRDIRKRQVLPVIGPGLVMTGGRETYAASLAGRLAEMLGVKEETNGSLNRVACLFLTRGGRRKEIYEGIRELVEDDARLPVPQGLADLAAIRDFDLFVTSTFDPFLTQALRQARPGFHGGPEEVAAFHPRKPVDIPDKRAGAFVYHVLGAWDTYPDFAVWEEDYMEFLCGLLESPKDTRKNLFYELRNRSLLMIGSPFDDWTARFFLRVAKQERLSDSQGGDYLAEDPASLGDPLVFYFDRILGSPTILPMTPGAFVAELRRRWEEKFATVTTEDLLESIADDMERGAVFISYSSDDLATAVKMAAGLKAAGIPVWLDKKRLQAGGDWEQALKRAVKSRSSLFLSLISRATEGDADRFVHQERQWAADVFVPGEIFYIPVILDDTPLGEKEPMVFAKLQRHRLPGGDVTEEFVLLLKKYLAQYHAEGEVRDV